MIEKIISRESFTQFKKFFQYGIGNFFAILIPIVVAKKTIDICGEEGFGKTSIALAVCFILSIFIEFGSFVSPLSKVSIYRNDLEKLKKIFSVVFYARIFLFIGTLILLGVLTLFINYFNDNFWLYFLSSTIFIGQVLNPLYFLQGLEDFKNTAIFTALCKIIYVVFILLFIHSKTDYIFVNFYLGIANTIVFAIANVFLFKKYKIQLIKVKTQEILNYLKEDCHLLINSFSLVSILYAPIIFIGLLSGDFWAGIYKVLDIFVTLLRNYLLLFFNSIYPKTCLLLSKSHQQGSKFILKYSIISTVFLLFFIGSAIFFKQFFLLYFLKSNSNLIAKYFNFVAIPILIASCNIPFLQILFFYKKKQYYSKIYFIGAIMNIVLSFILIYFYKITGLIIALIVTETFLTLSFIFSTEFLLKEISILDPHHKNGNKKY